LISRILRTIIQKQCVHNFDEFSLISDWSNFQNYKPISVIWKLKNLNFSDIKYQLRYLFWLLESLSQSEVLRPPPQLLQNDIDEDFPNPNMSDGYWNNFITNKSKGRPTLRLVLKFQFGPLIGANDGEPSDWSDFKMWIRKTTLTRQGIKIISQANVSTINLSLRLRNLANFKLMLKSRFKVARNLSCDLIGYYPENINLKR